MFEKAQRIKPTGGPSLGSGNNKYEIGAVARIGAAVFGAGLLFVGASKISPANAAPRPATPSPIKAPQPR